MDDIFDAVSGRDWIYPTPREDEWLISDEIKLLIFRLMWGYNCFTAFGGFFQRTNKNNK